MVIKSTRLGELAVPEEQLLHFPSGLPGFESEQRFAMVAYPQPDTPFLYLQSADTPDLTFLAVDPFALFNDYQIDLAAPVEEELGVNSANPPYIACLVSVPRNGSVRDMTVNLLAPVVVNMQSRRARQVVLENAPYRTKHRVFPQEQNGEGGK